MLLKTICETLVLGRKVRERVVNVDVVMLFMSMDVIVFLSPYSELVRRKVLRGKIHLYTQNLVYISTHTAYKPCLHFLCKNTLLGSGSLKVSYELLNFRF